VANANNLFISYMKDTEVTASAEKEMGGYRLIGEG
jgi:hypothetical protein